MRVADYILSALRDQGVEHCFIDLGGLNDNFMPALTGTKGLRTIVAAFEGGAAYMADGYARASGGLGVCFGIGGPGVLNMTTACCAWTRARIVRGLPSIGRSVSPVLTSR
jgi:acetolactate synthase-1/2/3 large subunit